MTFPKAGECPEKSTVPTTSDPGKSGASRCGSTSAGHLPARDMCCPCSAIANDGTLKFLKFEGPGFIFYLISRSCHLGILAQSQASLSKHFHRAAMVCANSFHLPFVFPRVAGHFPFNKAEEALPQSWGEAPQQIWPSMFFSLSFSLWWWFCPALPFPQPSQTSQTVSSLTLLCLPSPRPILPSSIYHGTTKMHITRKTLCLTHTCPWIVLRSFSIFSVACKYLGKLTAFMWPSPMSLQNESTILSAS